MSRPRITRLMLHEKWKSIQGSTDEKKQGVLNYLKTLLTRDVWDRTVTEELNESLNKQFYWKYNTLWQSAHRVESKFVEKHKTWLQAEITFPEYFYNNPINL